MVMMVCCPTCRRALGISEENLGKAMRCPLCHRPFLAPPPRPASAPVSLPLPAPAPPPDVPVYDLLVPDEPPLTWHQPPPVRGFPDFELGPPDAAPPPRQAPPTPPREHLPPLEIIPMLGLDPTPAASEAPRAAADYELVPEPPQRLPEVEPLDEVLPLPAHEDDQRQRPRREAKRDEQDREWYDDRSARSTGRDRPRRRRRDLSRRDGEGVVVGSGGALALLLGITSCCLPVLGFPMGLVGYYVAEAAMRDLGYRDANSNLLYWGKLLSVGGMVLSVCVVVLFCSLWALGFLLAAGGA